VWLKKMIDSSTISLSGMDSFGGKSVFCLKDFVPCGAIRLCLSLPDYCDPGIGESGTIEGADWKNSSHR
jgi:hypothetical protein